MSKGCPNGRRRTPILEPSESWARGPFETPNGGTTGNGAEVVTTSVTGPVVESLPATGAPGALPLVLALVLLAAGGLLVVGSRRRRPRARTSE